MNNTWTQVAVDKCTVCADGEYDGVLPFDETLIYTVSGNLTQFYVEYARNRFMVSRVTLR